MQTSLTLTLEHFAARQARAARPQAGRRAAGLTGRARCAFALLVVCACLVGSLAGGVDVAAATTFDVNDTSDIVDANVGDGVCDADLVTDGDQCTFRAATQEANFDTDSTDTINVPEGTYALTIPAPPPAFEESLEEDEAHGDLDLKGQVNVIGAGTGKTIIDAAGAADRGLHIIDVQGCESPGNDDPQWGDFCTLSGITVTNGHPQSIPDGALPPGKGCSQFLGPGQGNSAPCPDGGGMLISCCNMAITDISADHNEGRDGGGITAFGTFYKFNFVSASDNTARASGGGVFMNGATIQHILCLSALRNEALGTEDGNNGSGDGGGLLFAGNTLYDVKFATADDNTAASRGGGMFANGDTD